MVHLIAALLLFLEFNSTTFSDHAVFSPTMHCRAANNYLLCCSSRTVLVLANYALMLDVWPTSHFKVMMLCSLSAVSLPQNLIYRNAHWSICLVIWAVLTFHNFNIQIAYRKGPTLSSWPAAWICEPHMTKSILCLTEHCKPKEIKKLVLWVCLLVKISLF